MLRKKEIQHFIHDHPLTLEDYDLDVPCMFCWRSISPVGYFCKEKRCYPNFRIHRSCAELPQEMVHPFHPHHILTLLRKDSYDKSESVNMLCCACGGGGISRDFTYNCSQCKFYLDINCASLMPIKDNSKPQNLDHPHPLILCSKSREFQPYCSGCKLPIKDSSVYVCLDCKCLLDKSCAEWPFKIEHPFHPQHSLTLQLVEPQPVVIGAPPVTGPDYCCRACGGNLHGVTFCCSECKFSLHSSCASLMPPEDYGQGGWEFRFGHRHPLIPCKMTRKGLSLSCSACLGPFTKEECDDSAIYMCLDCSFLLHQSCADLPREIKDRIHHPHTLSLLECAAKQAVDFYSKEKKRFDSISDFIWVKRGAIGCFECHACVTNQSGFAYKCSDCMILFDLYCALVKPRVVKCELHPPHPLAFFPYTQTKFDCNTCREPLFTPLFRCVKCNFNLHVGCVPNLPPTVKHQCHRHPPTLTSSPIKDREDEDDKAEYYCDVCEQKRSLFERTYYCEECHYVSHIHCVISEVLKLLEDSDVLSTMSNTLRIEEIREQEPESLAASHASLDESKMASNSSNDVLASAGMAKDSFLIELDEEIDILSRKMETLVTALKEKEGRLKELEEKQHSQHIASAMP